MKCGRIFGVHPLNCAAHYTSVSVSAHSRTCLWFIRMIASVMTTKQHSNQPHIMYLYIQIHKVTLHALNVLSSHKTNVSGNFTFDVNLVHISYKQHGDRLDSKGFRKRTRLK